MEPMGPKIRKKRRRLAFTLDDLAGRTGISKPYLSLIETGRVPNPPSDEKLRKLEQVLEFKPGELVTQAHLHRTPRDVRAVLQRLIEQGRQRAAETASASMATLPETKKANGKKQALGSHLQTQDSALRTQDFPPAPIDLDDAYLTGVLQELVDHSTGNVETIRTGTVPVINRVSAGYPRDFTDLSFPPRVADSYVGCPDLADPDAFAARVHGDSMTPKYCQGDIVIFSPAAPTRDGQDCFVRFEDGQTTFKRVFAETAEDGSQVLRLQPRNERYRPKIVPRADISGVYPAVYQYRKVCED